MEIMATTAEVAAGGALETVKALGAWVVALIGALGAWWAWRTSILKTMSERIAALEAKVDQMQVAAGGDAYKIASLTGENIALRAELARALQDKETWRERYLSRRARHKQDTAPQGQGGRGLDTDSDHDADDDLAADRSGEIERAP